VQQLTAEQWKELIENLNIIKNMEEQQSLASDSEDNSNESQDFV